MIRSTRHRTLHVISAALAALTLALSQPWTLLAQSGIAPSKVRFAQISETDMREFLTYLASDAMLGRSMYSEGYGMAAQYVADHLKAWGVKPMGDAGGYFQMVKNRGYRVTRNSSVTVEVGGKSRTFKHGDHVTFPVNSGGEQTLTFDGLEFVGYGMVALPSATSTVNYNDFAGRQVRGKAIMWMFGTPAVLSQGGRGGRGGGNRSPYAIQSMGAAAAFAYQAAPPAPTPADVALQQAQDALVQAQQAVAAAQAQVRGGGAGRAGGRQAGRGGQPPATADVTTVQNVEALTPPAITADDEFYNFVFGAERFADIKARSAKGEALTPATIPAKITINIANTYDVISTQYTKNVVGLIEGSDPKLKDTYVLFGSHLDHVAPLNAAQAGRAGGTGAAAPAGPPDLINNGADDDGSGSVALGCWSPSVV